MLKPYRTVQDVLSSPWAHGQQDMGVGVAVVLVV